MPGIGGGYCPGPDKVTRLHVAAAASVVRQQAAAMGCELFEVGVFRPETPRTDAGMLLRVWDWDTLLRAVPWLQLQNHADRHIYIRPRATTI